MGQVPYHGPHVVLSLAEARALKESVVVQDDISTPEDKIQDAYLRSALEKIEWALTKSHPKFLIPHE